MTARTLRYHNLVFPVLVKCFPYSQTKLIKVENLHSREENSPRIISRATLLCLLNAVHVSLILPRNRLTIADPWVSSASSTE